MTDTPDSAQDAAKEEAGRQELTERFKAANAGAHSAAQEREAGVRQRTNEIDPAHATEQKPKKRSGSKRR